MKITHLILENFSNIDTAMNANRIEIDFTKAKNKIILFDTSGKFFNINANEIPSGRGFGQPLRLMVDLSNNDNIADMFVFKAKEKYLIASNNETLY